MNLHGSRGLSAGAVSVVSHAVKEMRKKGEATKTGHLMYDKVRLRVEATVWLASSRAIRWFDACGLDQAYTLFKVGWPTHARELLDDVDLDPEQTQVLELGLDAVGSTK